MAPVRDDLLGCEVLVLPEPVSPELGLFVFEPVSPELRVTAYLDGQHSPMNMSIGRNASLWDDYLIRRRVARPKGRPIGPGTARWRYTTL